MAGLLQSPQGATAELHKIEHLILANDFVHGFSQERKNTVCGNRSRLFNAYSDFLKQMENKQKLLTVPVRSNLEWFNRIAVLRVVGLSLLELYAGSYALGVIRQNIIFCLFQKQFSEPCGLLLIYPPFQGRP
jgi:hypothetical protein